MALNKVTTTGQVRTLIVNNSGLITVDSYETEQSALNSLIQCTPVGPPVHFNLEPSKDKSVRSPKYRGRIILKWQVSTVWTVVIVQGRLYERPFVHAAVNIGVHKRWKIICASWATAIFWNIYCSLELIFWLYYHVKIDIFMSRLVFIRWCKSVKYSLRRGLCAIYGKSQAPIQWRGCGVVDVFVVILC